MLNLLWLIPTFPIVSFFILALFGKRMNRTVAGIFGVGSVGLSALTTLLVSAGYAALPHDIVYFSQNLWSWITAGPMHVTLSLYLDPLSLLMTLVVTIVGFLIHLYSASFMADDDSFSRFFAYMNLFIAFMIILVLADNLLMLLLGWEGVGLCSYLLIGFWYDNPSNGAAARKAFIVTRIGDTALLVALFLLFRQFGTFNIQELMTAAQTSWPLGSGMALAVAILLLGGAVGKSAQLPLQTWLPDAMAGPTPVSALIHAATMVTAGVYLIARMHTLFDLAPIAQAIVAIVGAATLLIAGLAALSQKDIKRILAYSTISQIGYMFLALGVGAYTSAMFHFMTHAFFKALLFLGAGVIIISLHHEHNIFKMGGLKKKLPVTYWTFLIGCMSLSAVPLISSGFYSKDQIIWMSLVSPSGNFLLWLAAIVGALLTALYTFRMFFVTFHGKTGMEPEHKPSRVLLIPLAVLAGLSTLGGFINTPATLGDFRPFEHFLAAVLPSFEIHAGIGKELLFQLISAVVALGGIYLAYLFHLKKAPETEAREHYPLSPGTASFFLAGLGFDRLYDTIIVRPYIWLANINKNDVIDLIYTGIAWINIFLSKIFSDSQNGRVRTYAYTLAVGAVIITGMVIFL